MTLEEIDTRFHEAALEEEAETWPENPGEPRDRGTEPSDAGRENAGRPSSGDSPAA